MIEDDWEESAGWDINSGDKGIKEILPENKNTPICMGCGESYFRIKFVVRIEGATIFGGEMVGSNSEIRLKKPGFRQEDKIWVLVIYNSEEVNGDSLKAFAVPGYTFESTEMR